MLLSEKISGTSVSSRCGPSGRAKLSSFNIVPAFPHSAYQQASLTLWKFFLYRISGFRPVKEDYKVFNARD